MNKLISLIIIINFMFVVGCDGQNSFNQLSSQKPIIDWQNVVSSSFDKAEKEVFINPSPPPKPDDGTNPDPAKCICKGTGIIVQGDRHKTQCPYHSKTNSTTPIFKK